MDGEAALGVVDQTEVLASLVDRDDVHVTSGIGSVGANFTVDLDEALHDDLLDLTAIESILKTVANEDDER